MTFTVALLQMAAGGHGLATNQAKAEKFCREAADLGADIAVFPEMWSNGYAICPKDQRGHRAWIDGAVAASSPFVDRFRTLARELNMAIVTTYLEQWPGAPRDSAMVIDRHGASILTYAKVHTCDFGMEANCTPGDGFPVGTLDTRDGPVMVGVMICYDREFPEAARLLMLGGAEIVLTPNACTLDPARLAQFRTRAFENMIGVAMANYAAPDQNGHSVAYSPIVHEHDETPIDPTIVLASEAEGMYLAPFDIERIRDWRAVKIWADAYRRPSRYQALTADQPLDVFRRLDARRG